MPITPLKITLYGPRYDEDATDKKTFSRTIIPWGVLKKAISLTKSIDQENASESDMDAIAGLVAEAFGGQFSIEELDNGADIGEMLAVLQGIVTRASALVKANPTAGQTAPKKPSK